MIVTDYTPSLVLVIVMGGLLATGVYLVLERSLTRVLIGIALIGNGVNLLILIMGGAAGAPPLIGSSEEPMSDPIPQALVLTAIVITLGFTAFILAMAYRSWQLTGHDEIQDDVEDRRIARRAERGELDLRSDEEGRRNAALEAAQIRDETEDDDDDAHPSTAPTTELAGPPPGAEDGSGASKDSTSGSGASEDGTAGSGDGVNQGKEDGR